MKILILGHGRHGKDTVAELVRELFGYRFQSSSIAACERAVLPVLAPHYGYTSVLECFEDRGNHREEWRDLIREYNKDDRTRLTREILKEYDCYVGMRCSMEFEASKDLFDVIIWVDASQRKPQDPSMGIRYEPGRMIWLDNNGPESELRSRVEDLALHTVEHILEDC